MTFVMPFPGVTLADAVNGPTFTCYTLDSGLEPSAKMIEQYVAYLVWLFLLNPVPSTVQQMNVAKIRAG